MTFFPRTPAPKRRSIGMDEGAQGYIPAPVTPAAPSSPLDIFKPMTPAGADPLPIRALKPIGMAASAVGDFFGGIQKGFNESGVGQFASAAMEKVQEPGNWFNKNVLGAADPGTPGSPEYEFAQRHGRARTGDANYVPTPEEIQTQSVYQNAALNFGLGGGLKNVTRAAPVALPAPKAPLALAPGAIPMRGAIAQPSPTGRFFGAVKDVQTVEPRGTTTVVDRAPAAAIPITRTPNAGSGVSPDFASWFKKQEAATAAKAGVPSSITPETMPLADLKARIGVKEPAPLSFKQRVGPLTPIGREDLTLGRGVARGREPVPPVSIDELRSRIGAKTPADNAWQEGVPLNAEQLSARIGAKTRSQADVAQQLSGAVEARQAATGTLGKSGMSGPLVGRAIGRGGSQLDRAQRQIDPLNASGTDLNASLVRQTKVHDANEAAIAAAKAGDQAALARAKADVQLLGGDLKHTDARIRRAGAVSRPTTDATLMSDMQASIDALKEKGGTNVPSSAGTAPSVPDRGGRGGFLKDQGGSTSAENALGVGIFRRAKGGLSTWFRDQGGEVPLTRADAARIRAERKAGNTYTAADASFDKMVPPTAKSEIPVTKERPTLPTGGPPQQGGVKGFLKGEGRGATAKGVATDVLNMPRTLMTTADVSYSLRQGLVLGAGHPIEFSKAMYHQLRAFGSEKYALERANKISSDPALPVLQKLGLGLTDWTGKLGPMEEGFLSRTLGASTKSPVRWSNRAGVTFLNELRFNVAKDTLRASEILNGEVVGKRASQLSDMMNFINAASGRGDLRALQPQTLDALNGLLFSPRLIKAHYDVATALPLAAIKRNPLLAKEAARDIGAVIVAGLGIMKLAEMNGAKVESEPTSTDWGKIQVGNTRIDIWGGYQQYARYIAQMIEGKKTSLSGTTTQLVDKAPLADLFSGATGGGYTTSNGFKVTPKSRAYETGRMIRSKLAPVPGTAVDLGSGSDYIGKPNTPAGVAGGLITPLGLQDIYDAIADDLANGGSGWQGAAAGSLGLLGVGTNTIPDNFDTNTPTVPEAIGGAVQGQPFFRQTGAPTTPAPAPTKTPAPSKTPKPSAPRKTATPTFFR